MTSPSVALEKKQRRKTNRKLRQLGERPVTADQNVRCREKAAKVCHNVQAADNKSLSMAERAAAKASNKRMSDTWDKREPGNVGQWFNPTGKLYAK